MTAMAGRLPGEPRAPAARDGLPGVNNEGRVCVQIGVIGHAWAPFTDGPVVRGHDIVGWLDSWHVTREWPAGRPAPVPGSVQPGQQRRRNWARGGHFGASQVPGCSGSGPGAIDTGRLTGSLQQRRRNWARGGHFGASQVPGCSGSGPGAIDTERLTGSLCGQHGAPAPRAPGSPARIPAMTWQPRLTAARSAAP